MNVLVIDYWTFHRYLAIASYQHQRPHKLSIYIFKELVEVDIPNEKNAYFIGLISIVNINLSINHK